MIEPLIFFSSTIKMSYYTLQNKCSLLPIAGGSCNEQYYLP